MSDPTNVAPPAPPRMPPRFAIDTPLDACANAGSFGGATHSFVDSEQLAGIRARPTPSSTPPATIAAAPSPTSTSGPGDRFSSGTTSGGGADAVTIGVMANGGALAGTAPS